MVMSLPSITIRDTYSQAIQKLKRKIKVKNIKNNVKGNHGIMTKYNINYRRMSGMYEKRKLNRSCVLLLNIIH